MKWRHLLLLFAVPAWLLFLWYSLMMLAYAEVFSRTKIGQPAWMWPGSILLFSGFVLTTVAAFNESPGHKFSVALTMALFGSVFMWKSYAVGASHHGLSGELFYVVTFVGIGLTLLYFSIRYIFDRDNSFD
jgi:hypothetical protein